MVCSVALNSFLRTVLATVLGDDATDNEMRLFWGGVFIQVDIFGDFKLQKLNFAKSLVCPGVFASFVRYINR